MKVFYKTPLALENGSIQIELVFDLVETVFPNGIQHREVKIVRDIYPNRALLDETVRRAFIKYNAPEAANSKNPQLLALEIQALQELATVLNIEM